jgi:hypothetical protein
MSTEAANRTIEEMCRDLADISKEFLAQAQAKESSNDEEAILLAKISECADTARERLLDIAVAMTRYVTYCLEQEENRVDG